MARDFGAWSVSSNPWTGPLEAKAAELPERVGSEAETNVWRDRTVQTAQSDWWGDQPGGWERRPRFAGVRHRAAEEMVGRYAFLTTHEQESLGAAGLRASPIEGGEGAAVEPGVEGFGSAPPPCQDLNANRSV
jgi:hypothetical protein